MYDIIWFEFLFQFLLRTAYFVRFQLYVKSSMKINIENHDGSLVAGAKQQGF